MYANLPSRVKALCVDQFLLIVAMYAVSEVLALFQEVPDGIRIFAFVALFVLYEPLFVSIYGGTIGHSFAKITVRKSEDTSQKISFIAALIRFLVKIVLGVISFFTLTKKHPQAIHDELARAIVVEET